MNDPQEKLLDHDYDGIQELDNDLPRWWVWLFYITIVWSVLYMLYYHVFAVGYSSADQYRQEIDATWVRSDEPGSHSFGVTLAYRSPWYDPVRDGGFAAKIPVVKAVYAEETRDKDTATYVAFTDVEALREGQTIYDRLCFTCHGKAGEGGIGPNLTDEYWLHGASFSDVVKTIKFGVPTKGMVPWRFELTAEQILKVGSYTMTLRGTNPPNAKAPQGTLIAHQ